MRSAALTKDVYGRQTRQNQGKKAADFLLRRD
jgi:hypothetical protein